MCQYDDIKVKFTLEQAMKAQRGSRGTDSLTWALDGGGWSTPPPSHCTPGKDTLYGMLGGPHCQSEQVWKILPPPGFDPWTVQPIASCYIDYTIPAHYDDTPLHYPSPL